jgi:hypothetical protein
MAARSRRQPAGARRDRRVGLTFTKEEKERLRAAAARCGMAPAAYAAQAALDRADGHGEPPARGGQAGPEVLAALMAIVSQMQAAGNNLNQAVRKLHATGQRPGRLSSYAARVMDAVDAASDAIEELRPPRHW